jgi:DNA processing protein
MTEKEIRIYSENLWNKGLKNMPHKPKKLFIKGFCPDNKYKFLTVIGPRKPSEYSINVVNFLIRGLANLPIYIVSGLAYGIDSMAHDLAIQNNLKTLAFPGSGLDSKVLYPKTNIFLAEQIIEKGGALISEYQELEQTRPYFFPQRNRLMAGISDAVLIIEAGKKSGSMITAKLALEYNKEVLCVPGSIFNENAEGVNDLIKQGATPICKSDEIISILGLDNLKSLDDTFFENSTEINALEKQVLKFVKQGKNNDQIIQELNINIEQLSRIISTLEIYGFL